MLVLGFAISAWLAWHLHVRARDLDKQRLKRVAESVRDDLDTVVEKTEALLRQAQGFFGSREDVTTRAFADWVLTQGPAFNYPWIHGMGFYTNKSAGRWRAELQTDPARWTKEQRERFGEWAARTPIVLGPGETCSQRGFCRWPTNYLWHWDYREVTNSAGFEPERCVVGNGTRTTGRQPVMIVESNVVEVQYGASLLLPLYTPDRARLLEDLWDRSTRRLGMDESPFNWNLCRGILVIPIDYNEIISQIPSEHREQVGVEIFASRTPSAESWLNYRAGKPRALDPQFRPYLATTTQWQMYQRAWSLYVYTLPVFEAESPRRLAWVPAGAGGALSALASALVAVALRARGRQQQMTEQIREARDALATAQRERERLSHDLHDHTIQALYAIQLRLGRTAKEFEAEPANTRREFEEVRADLDTVIAEVRSFILSENGESQAVDLGGVFRALAQRAQAGVRARIDVHCENGASGRLSAEVAVQLANIAREALSNSLRHGEPGWVRIALRSENDAVWLDVADDGTGFEPKAPARQGVGERSMAKRARQIGAVLDIQSAPGRGTRVTVQVPVAAKSVS